MEPTENQGPYQPRTPPMAEDDPVVRWLLQGDPAIRWQVLRDLVNASQTEVATERARGEVCGGTGPASRAPRLSPRPRRGRWLPVSHRRRSRRPRRNPPRHRPTG